MLFYRFISENLTNYLNKAEHEAGNADFDYAKLSDEDALYGNMLRAFYNKFKDIVSLDAGSEISSDNANVHVVARRMMSFLL